VEGRGLWPAAPFPDPDCFKSLAGKLRPATDTKSVTPNFSINSLNGLNKTTMPRLILPAGRSKPGDRHSGHARLLFYERANPFGPKASA
jgi:hypothetical protein